MKFETEKEREGFISENMNLVYARVRALNNGRFDDDMAGEGFIGLIKAVDKFDLVSAKYRFSSFAVIYIDGHIKKYKQRRRKHKDVLSLSSPVSKADTSGTKQTLGDLIPSPEDLALEVTVSVSLGDFLKNLSDRDRRIVLLLLQGETGKESAAVIGCSEQTVRRVKKQIKEKIGCVRW